MEGRERVVGLPQIPGGLLVELHVNAAEVAINGNGTELRYAAGAIASDESPENVPTLGQLAEDIGIPPEFARWAYYGLSRAKFLDCLKDSVKEFHPLDFVTESNSLLSEPAIFRLARIQPPVSIEMGSRTFEDYFPKNRWGEFNEVSRKLIRMIEILEKNIEQDSERWFKTKGKFVKAISLHAGKGVLSDTFILAGLLFLTDIGVLECKGESKHFYRFYQELDAQMAGYLKAYNEPIPWYNNLTLIDVNADPDQKRVFDLTCTSAASIRQMKRDLERAEQRHDRLLKSSMGIKESFDQRRQALDDVGLG